jgi:anaerobic magnesium-protoporphyrin IX monomethyl ester cyclase
MAKRVLLVCPHSALEVFKESKISLVVPHIPYVSLASLAGMALKHGHSVQILDLSISSDPFFDLLDKLKKYKPDTVGVTFTTSLFQEAKEVAKRVKEFDQNIKIIAGGAHPSIFPEEVVEKCNFDIVVYGEGEITLAEVLNDRPLNEIDGIAYRSQSGEVIKNNPRALIENLDDLPYPALYLYQAKNYHTAKVNAKKSPVAAIETSRGCPYSCIFCSKHIFTNRLRKKSPQRVADEIEMVLDLGYREIHIWDDCFSADLNHAKAVCDEIIRRGLKFPWNIYNGIRVDRVDEELLNKLKAAGCYRISFGIESGDQNILDKVKKGITLEQAKEAVKMAKDAGIETLGFFMIGLPGETPESIKRTMEFVKELDVDLPKVGIATPLPGTPFFDEWKSRGLIHSFNWADYVMHSETRIASYPNFKDEEIFKYYNQFYRQLYLRPKFILKRLWRGIKTGEIFFDIYYFLKVFLKFKW